MQKAKKFVLVLNVLKWMKCGQSNKNKHLNEHLVQHWTSLKVDIFDAVLSLT